MAERSNRAMNISILGCGYVGAVTGICLAELGNRIVLADIDTKKIDLLRKGEVPVFEPGLQEMYDKNRGRIRVTGDLGEAVLPTDLTFICVGTPSREDGSIDLSFVRKAAEDLGALLSDKPDHMVVVKSTVVPGTAEEMVMPALRRAAGKSAGDTVRVGVNPEFLREGKAVRDFFEPDRIILGVRDPETRRIFESLYEPFPCPKVFTSLRCAEMIKYVSNAFLATKISFSNEIGNICKATGIDAYEVFHGVGLDSRISPAFFRCGIGFGGSCFPKDLRALAQFSRQHAIPTPMLDAVVAINEAQPQKMISLLKKHINPLSGRTIGVLGLTFKPDTDDIRESRALPLIMGLLREGARVIAYDPLGMENFRRILPEIAYADRGEEVLPADAVLIVTEWAEFERLDYSGKVVIDGRRVENARKTSRIYEGVCW
jgi:UDPglucose 6-dehydrogenase